ncbi:hypothetical protein [Flavihumibacter petaseus]|uniref:Uncharacterized protein n=1 Tax=Flavihumibacter petaseus NBRC 106054 TaxID=1220578 RepID=A0A0E9MZV9_9BACT|nr:hypothetical protein [Flavihumibacter petaseus]GAO42665.1 hypothetical protein FPE01S_01_16800 [Flavihumibacter petaseus NBRC 106054]
MKKYAFYVAGILLTFLLACNKDNDLPLPPGEPTDPSLQRTFRLVFDAIPDAGGVIHDLKAMITIRNVRNEVVVADKEVAIEHNGTYRTLPITLGKGEYRISALMIRQANLGVRFASPVAGSEKATQVAHPLSVSIVLSEKTEKLVAMDVLPVAATDQPQSFGYPEGSFGDRQQDPGAGERHIFIRPLIKIGDIVYDSVPVQLVLRSWDSQNEMTYQALYLPAGLQAVTLPANAVRYQLSVSKWNTYDEIMLEKRDVEEGAIYSIGGAAAAKKLKSAIESKIVSGVSTAVSKTDFVYDGDGNLKEKLFWLKRNDGTPYISNRDEFTVENGKLAGQKTYNEQNALISLRSFQYNTSGKVNRMFESKDGQTTTAIVSYIPLETQSGITQDYRAEIEYQHSAYGKPYYYSKTMRGGSVLEDVLRAVNGGVEEANFAYDFEINPYVHLGLPDFQLSNEPRHNMKVQRKHFYGAAWAEAVAYDFSYKYDGDGYPTEVIAKYWSYDTKQDLYSIRTVFKY